MVTVIGPKLQRTNFSVPLSADRKFPMARVTLTLFKFCRITKLKPDKINGITIAQEKKKKI